MMRLAPLQLTDEALARYAALMAQVFPASARLDAAYLDWLYRRNPDGLAMGFDAWHGDELVAHYACVPCYLRLQGQTVSALLSLNTATHPDHRGQGLFTQLAQMTYEQAAAQGYAAIYGVANAQSTPGFVRKLQFALVEPLQVLLGLPPAKVAPGALMAHTRMARAWSDAAWTWRLACPRNPVQVLSRPDGGLTCLAPSHKPGILAQATLPNGLAPRLQAGSPATGWQGWPSPLRVFVGLWPGQAMRHPLAWPLPARLRASPLNLIYRPLGPSAPGQLSAGQTFMTFLDFDAF